MHEGDAARGEEAAAAFEGFEVVFAGDDGVVAAVAGDLVVEETAVLGIGGGDELGAGPEDALPAIRGLELIELFFFLPESVRAGADGAKVNGRGVVCGAHGGEDGFEIEGILVLEFVDDEQAIGGFSAGEGLGMAGDEDD